MKKNGYLRRFLALFLALVMIMADSSVTTFAATVGRVKQKSAAAESSSQCNVQINVAEELDVEQFNAWNGDSRQVARDWGNIIN